MKDIEMRGIILQKYYELRRKNFQVLQARDFDNTLTQEEISDISRQLSEHYLIEWKPMGVGSIVGMGRITAQGIDVIEDNGKNSPIQIILDSRQYNISHASNIQIGDHNIQDVTMFVKENSIESLTEYLRAQAVGDKDIEELKKIIRDTPKPKDKSDLRDKLGSWIGKMAEKAASGIWKIASSTAADLLTKALCVFYGLS
ncbi:MAG: hypothetical protein PHO30_02995 [Candidatus Omnitrophica bacterium]|nr:hypothetical protein [Candidatus Omnitrophota bacterium]